MNYERIYNQLIEKARSENRKKLKSGIYYEAHHIIPKCMGGPDDLTNLVLLTAKEHYMAHRLLCNIYPEHTGIYYAMICMIGGWYSKNVRYSPTSKIYERLRSSSMCGTRPKEIGIKISKALKGRVLSEETKKRMSESAKKKPLVSEETKKKMSLAKKGKSLPPISDETRSRLSYASKNRIRKPFSEESKKKMSASAKKKPPVSIETRRKLSESGKNMSEETKKKISLAKKGIPRSEETRRKITESWKNRKNINIK
jgi:hypothetical protein